MKSLTATVFSIILSTLMSILAPPSVLASDITVTTKSDIVNGDTSSPEALFANPGPDGISLREAFLAITNAPGPHTITFSPSLAGQVIELTEQLPRLVQNGITIQGLKDANGQPNITLSGPSEGTALVVFASDFSITGIRFINIPAGAAILISAGTRPDYPPAQSQIVNINIEGNVFSNENSSATGHGIALGTSVLSSGATIRNVFISNNKFLHLQGDFDAIGAGSNGTNGRLENIVIYGNLFSECTYGVELGAPGVNCRDSRMQIIGNTFTNSIGEAIVLLLGSALNQPPSSGDVIDSTFIYSNVFTGGHNFPIGITSGAQAPTTGDSILNTNIVNNLFTNNFNAGILIRGGDGGATGNGVRGLRIVNNTITQDDPRSLALGIYSNVSGASGNSVKDVEIINTIFSGPNSRFDGEVSPAQVRFSITQAIGFAGVNGNIAADPKFVDTPNGDFHLQPGSPAIDAGTSNGASLLDLEGRQRFDDPSTPNTGAGTMPYYDIGALEYGNPRAAFLAVIKFGSGGGQVSCVPAGISGGADFLSAYNLGTMVRLTATPDAQSTFAGWSGDVNDLANTITVTLDTSKFLVANFAAITAPTTPLLLSPPNGAINQQLNDTLRWNAVQGADSYRVQVATNQNFSSTFEDDSTLTAAYRTIGPLSLNTTYYWRVSAKNVGGASDFSPAFSFKTILSTNIELSSNEIPKEYSLSQNFPNPFNPTTVIEFSLPKSGYVSLVVFNNLGQQVQTIIAQQMTAGRYRAQWNAVNFASGIYFYQVRAGEFAETKKLVLIR
ncbi:MAG: T9SS type A sorting domain-containing protein [Melioribacteraceae bacterium]